MPRRVVPNCTPLNPFYLGEHPSQACAAPGVSCQDCKESPKNADPPAANAAGSPAEDPCPGKKIPCLQGEKSDKACE